MSKTSQELYTKWQGVIKACVQYRNKIISDEDFKTFSNYYKGRFNKDKKEADRVEVNLVYSTTNVLMSALASKDPWVAFKARKDEYKSRETICEESLNNTFSDIGFKHTLQEVIRDAQLYGYGVGKTGYTFEADEEKTEKKKKDIKDEQAEQPQYHMHIKKDTVYFNLIDPKKILLDPTSLQGIKDSKFVIEVLTQNKTFLSEKYNIDLSKITVGIPAFLKDKFDDLDKESQKVFDMCIFYEIWDIIKRKRYIMIEGYTEKVFEYEWPEYCEDYPYEVLIFNHAPNEPYGISDVSLYRTQQEELNVLRSTEADHVKKNNSRWQAKAEGADLKEIKKFMANEVGTVVGVKEINAIAPIQPHQFSTDFTTYEARIQNDVKETMGVSDFMRGGSTGKKTATEAYATSQYAQLRVGQRQNEVDNFVLNVAMKLFNIMQKEYDTPKFVQMAGEEGKYIAKEYTKKDIEGEYDLVVQQGTGAKAYQIQTIGAGLKMLNGNPLINPKEFTEIIVDTFLEGVDTSKLVIPNAEQIANDPIEREKWRQIMLVIQQQGALKQATSALEQPKQQPGAPKTLPGGSPMPGQPEGQPQMPAQAPQQPVQGA